MGSGASAQKAIEEASKEDVVAVIAELSPEERKNLQTAVMTVESNLAAPKAEPVPAPEP